VIASLYPWRSTIAPPDEAASDARTVGRIFTAPVTDEQVKAAVEVLREGRSVLVQAPDLARLDRAKWAVLAALSDAGVRA
jgi:hypothetical protein